MSSLITAILWPALPQRAARALDFGASFAAAKENVAALVGQTTEWGAAATPARADAATAVRAAPAPPDGGPAAAAAVTTAAAAARPPPPRDAATAGPAGGLDAPPPPPAATAAGGAAAAAAAGGRPATAASNGGQGHAHGPTPPPPTPRPRSAGLDATAAAGDGGARGVWRPRPPAREPPRARSRPPPRRPQASAVAACRRPPRRPPVVGGPPWRPPRRRPARRQTGRPRRARPPPQSLAPWRAASPRAAVAGPPTHRIARPTALIKSPAVRLACIEARPESLTDARTTPPSCDQPWGYPTNRMVRHHTVKAPGDTPSRTKAKEERNRYLRHPTDPPRLSPHLVGRRRHNRVRGRLAKLDEQLVVKPPQLRRRQV